MKPWNRAIGAWGTLLLVGCGDVQLDFFDSDAETVTTGGGGESTTAAGAVSGGTGRAHDVAGVGGALGHGGVPSNAPEPDPPSPRVLLIVDEAPTSTDDLIEMRATGLGAVVDRISELVATPADADSYDLVIVTPSADGADISAELRFVKVPLLSLEPAINDTLGLGTTLNDKGQDSFLIVEPTHPIAQGMSSPVEGCTRKVALEGTRLAAGGISIVESPVRDASLVFVFAAGTEVGGQPLPEMRLGVSTVKPSNCQTEISWQFFDRAVLFALKP